MITKTWRFGWLFGVFGAWVSYAAIVIVPGCGATDTDNGGTDSNTHWLEPCERESECDDNLSCVCGVCTTPCDDDDACSDLDGASCALANTCSGPREETSCVVGCQNDRECRDLGTSFVCDGGQCVHQSIAPGGSGGESGEPGGDAGSPAGATGGKGGAGGKGGVPNNGGSAGGPTPGGSGPSGGLTGFAGAGGYISVDGGSAPIGAGGTAGVGAVAGAGSPSTGGSGPTGPCAAMDVVPSGTDLPCLPGAPTYYWNGNFCTQFYGCQCTGEDCDEVYPTMAACDESYRACYQDLGITGECETDDDCKLTHRGCCASCGEQSFESLAATNAADEALWHYCPTDAACPPCVPGEPTPEAAARCVEGRCTVTSICTPLDEAACDAEELCDPVTAHVSGGNLEVYAGCLFTGSDAGSCDDVQSCAMSDSLTADVKQCLLFPTSCQPRGYSRLDCSTAACSLP